jgi:hypothetical protein
VTLAGERGDAICDYEDNGNWENPDEECPMDTDEVIFIPGDYCGEYCWVDYRLARDPRAIETKQEVDHKKTAKSFRKQTIFPCQGDFQGTSISDGTQKSAFGIVVSFLLWRVPCHLSSIQRDSMSKPTDDYYICINGRPVPFECRLGQHWNKEMNYCDEAHLAGCDVSQTIP